MKPCVTVTVCVCASHLLVLYLERGEACLELLQPQRELRLHLRLSGDLSHLIGAQTQSTIREGEREREKGRFSRVCEMVSEEDPSFRADLCACDSSHRVPHVGLEAPARWGAEGGGVEAQQALSITGRIQAFHCPLQHLQTCPSGRLHTQLC